MASLWPSYLALSESGELARRAQAASRRLADCICCPRLCHAGRRQDDSPQSYCRTGRRAMVARLPHRGEEDCLRGWAGSGTIFFSQCNLRCVFCQNFDISWEGHGRPVTAEELADQMLRLQELGCHNINFVTPSHVVPQILEALVVAAERGLRLPLVYNTGGYDRLETLRWLDGIVDIYMPDFKFWNPRRARSWPRRPTIPRWRGRRSRRCTGRWATWFSTNAAWPAGGCWCGTWSCPAAWMRPARSSVPGSRGFAANVRQRHAPVSAGGAGQPVSGDRPAAVAARVPEAVGSPGRKDCGGWREPDNQRLASLLPRRSENMSINYQILGQPGRDNALFVEVNTGQSIHRLQFDCGEACLRDLPVSQIQAIDALLFSHFHIDHVAGFDSFLRSNYDRADRPVSIWGRRGDRDHPSSASRRDLESGRGRARRVRGDRHPC